QQVGRIVQPHSRVERHQAGGCLLVVGTQTVLSAIGSVKRRVRLKDEIHLTREPEAGVFEVGEHRFRALFGRGVSHVSGGRRVPLRVGSGIRRGGSAGLLGQRRQRWANGGGSPEHKQQPACAEICEFGLPFHFFRCPN